MLRALMAVYAVAALVLAAIWVLGVVDLFDANFNEDRTLGDECLIGQAAVGILGVVAAAVAGGALTILAKLACALSRARAVPLAA